MAKLREIIRHRLEEAGTDLDHAFSGSAVERLCHASGGYLRDLMTLVQRACAAAKRDHPDLPLTERDASVAIRNLGAQRRAVAAGQREALRQVAETHRLDDLPPEARQALLHHRLVYEYFDGDYWYDASPLVA
jgi:CheY-like chemotaxis protein